MPGLRCRALDVACLHVSAPAQQPGGRLLAGWLPMTDPDSPAALRTTIERGGAPRYHESNAAKAKLFARERVRLLVDTDSFVEDGAYANAEAGDLPADGVVTGVAMIDGRPVAIMANDS